MTGSDQIAENGFADAFARAMVLVAVRWRFCIVHNRVEDALQAALAAITCLEKDATWLPFPEKSDIDWVDFADEQKPAKMIDAAVLVKKRSRASFW